MMAFDYVYLLWELVVIHTADCGLAMSSGDVLVIAHKLFIYCCNKACGCYFWVACSFSFVWYINLL